jgi:hypothetical protein
MTTRASRKVVQWLRLRHSLRRRLFERFDAAVVPRRARQNLGQPDLAGTKSLQRLGNQLRTVVHSQHHGHAVNGECLLEFDD